MGALIRQSFSLAVSIPERPVVLLHVRRRETDACIALGLRRLETVIRAAQETARRQFCNDVTPALELVADQVAAHALATPVMIGAAPATG